ncbi:XrtA/PEP-CTERM system-associated ATPase [Paraglaciecola sp. MB-3u-78]|jgi:general secretion pathway protein A|uniref:XrtA/PEP-CTERM system-associated ATPase n=1 Tax=Paraglaciecola sp. MB-3u-78 TaxID=2058332 RepID=UPI000C3286A5|nr:XrtA/PEP-CTERM system-associated ATPase [Paraglaciecola sp. MB-3u-78]PKG93413.1 general secretion pathway protein GspA [Paraglaciecola sp. MB-3u-78]
MYENYYGLTSKPFQLTPDPSFFYGSKWHKRAMSYLQYGLSQAEGFIVITGDIGTGKTTIANSLLDNMQQDIVAAQIVTPKLSPDELVKMVANKFNVPVKGSTKSDILNDLEAFLMNLHKQGKRALLLVDEAQNLPLETIEELRMLSNFQAAGKPLLQSFLLGQEELQPILRAPNMEQFRQRIVASCHLVPLTDIECQAYIEYRMQHAGWDGRALFSAGAYTQIFQFTHGIPRKINTLMDRILLFGFLEELETLDEEAVENVIKEVSEEMFLPEQPTPTPTQAKPRGILDEVTEDGQVKDVEYYKTMLTELVDALDNALSQKIKLTRYIDRLLQKKYKTYVRLKSDD